MASFNVLPFKGRRNPYVPMVQDLFQVQLFAKMMIFNSLPYGKEVNRYTPTFTATFADFFLQKGRFLILAAPLSTIVLLGTVVHALFSLLPFIGHPWKRLKKVI